MTIYQFNNIDGIITDAKKLCDKYGIEKNAPVNYVCIFSQSENEYSKLMEVAKSIGKIVQETQMGPVFQTQELPFLLKIRKPDPKRPERGDADFTLSDYLGFKKQNLGKPNIKLIERPNMEMLELSDPDFDVLAYFSYPTLAEALGIKGF